MSCELTINGGIILLSVGENLWDTLIEVTAGDRKDPLTRNCMTASGPPLPR